MTTQLVLPAKETSSALQTSIKASDEIYML